MITIEKNKREQIRIERGEYKGYDLVSIRVFYLDGEDWKPTRKGITFKAELLPEVIRALSQLGGQA
jgi:hypothetical protein